MQSLRNITADMGLGCVESVHEQILGDHIRDVASELRLVDVDQLIHFLKKENADCISDVVNSSAELFFKPGTLRYGLSGEFDVSWNNPPSVSLNMEFRNPPLTILFSLSMSSQMASVEIYDVHFEHRYSRTIVEVDLFSSSLSKARIDKKYHNS